MINPLFFFDTETFLITQHEPFPEMVCMSHIQGDSPALLHHARQSGPYLREKMQSRLSEPVVIVGQNVAYDLGVCATEWPELLELIFEKYDRGQVTDTIIRQQLIDIARGERKWYVYDGKIRKPTYTLDVLVRRNCPELSVDKEDPWRLRYSELADVHLKDWPADAKEYTLNDTVVTKGVYDGQESRGRAQGYLGDEFRQTRHAWALSLMSAHGIRTSADAVQKLKKAVQTRRAELKGELPSLVRKAGSRDTKAAKALMWRVCKKEGITPIFTTKGQETETFTQEYVSLSAEACERTLDTTLIKYAEYGTLTYVESKDVKALSLGMYGPIHAHYQSTQDTGRTSCAKPQLHNVRRLPGIRECFVPRDGKVFVQADYGGLEMACLAQVCWTWFGESELRLAINGDLDTHLAFAAEVMGLTYDVVKARYDAGDKEVAFIRQFCKAGQFGFPGGLGAKTFVEYARGYGIKDMTIEKAKELKANWLARWPEMALYFQRIGQLIDSGELLQQLFTERYRGGMTYCAACNSPFQGLGSDMAKDGLYQTIKEQYTDQGTALFGTRSVLFIHDEIILECDDGDQHDVALALRAAMLKPKEIWLPDVDLDVDYCAMAMWSKNAKRLLDEDERLEVWRG